MVDPASGPFLFDTSAEGWLARSSDSRVSQWLDDYLGRYSIAVSAITVVERVRGYALLQRRSAPSDRAAIERARAAYFSRLGTVLAVDSAVAIAAGEIMAMIPDPPTPPRRSHRMAESRQDRLARWRFDAIIAATAMVADIPLIHNNAGDFEAVRVALEDAPERFSVLGRLRPILCSQLV